MGLNARFLQIMIWLREKNYISPGSKVIELGAQQLNNGFLAARSEIDSLARLCNAPSPSLPLQIGNGHQHILEPTAPRAGPFYRALGFDYSCIDIDNDTASIALDLNFDAVPETLVGKFDFITNFGTTEHVVNQLNAFKIIHDLAAPGAIMLHELPASGQINHGFFGYQPKFFDRLASGNGYSVLFLDFSWSEVEYGIPDDLKQALAPFVNIDKRPPHGNSPSALTAILRKNNGLSFIPPIDVPYGSTAPSSQMQERYGPAFEPLHFPLRFLGKATSTFSKIKRRLIG